jgi:hypothetical protein
MTSKSYFKAERCDSVCGLGLAHPLLVQCMKDKGHKGEHRWTTVGNAKVTW